MKRLTFADLSDKKVYTVVITDPNGEPWEVGLKALSQEEFLQITDSVPEPQPPMAYVKGGRPVPLTDDPAYKKAVLDMNRERTYRWVAASLDFDIPGATLADKAKALRDGGPASWIMAQVVERVQRVMGLTETAITEREDSFQPA